MALRVEQVGARESYVDAQARDVEAQMPDEERFWGRMLHVRRVRLSRFRSGVVGLALVGAWLASVAAPPAALGAQIIHVWNYSGAMQNWTVPAGVHLAHFDVSGAEGGGVSVFLLPILKGGDGGRTVAEVRVFPGEVIHIFVGGKGGDGGTSLFEPSAEHSRGGFNGGGNGGFDRGFPAYRDMSGGGGGGGASDIRVDGTHLTNRYIIAGGGGGASERLSGCGLSHGGGGGGRVGGDGVAAFREVCTGGTGGTQTGAGNGGLAYHGGGGSLGFGGQGETPTGRLAGGGGGGGGYYGGGGGEVVAGGGGGSALGPRVDSPPVQFHTGVQKGNGQVLVTWEQPG